MVVVHTGNLEQQVIDMTFHQYEGSACGMIIKDLRFASQVIASSGKTWFFDDHGCMAGWLASRPFQDETVIWVYALDKNQWIDGRTAWYSRNDSTPMLYGFGAYQVRQPGFIDFTKMQQSVMQGETLANSASRKRGTGD